jgi:hypothetical protein
MTPEFAITASLGKELINGRSRIQRKITVKNVLFLTFCLALGVATVNAGEIMTDRCQIAPFLLVFAGWLLPQSAKAEWLWSDLDSLRGRFEKLINDNLPKGCHTSKDAELFGYQNAYQAANSALD